MNLLFLMGQYPSVGGVEKVSTVLANEFVNRGYGVSIVSFEQPQPEIAAKELDKRVRLYALEFPVWKKENLSDLRKLIRDDSIDIIINQWAVPFYVARLCRKAIKGTSCRLLTVHHNLPDTNARIKDVEIAIENGIGTRVVNRMKLTAIKTISRLSLRGVYRLSDRYIVLSESFKDIARKFIGISTPSKILSIPNPLTIPDTEEESSLAKEKEIIYVGRIEYNQKRTFRLLDIWKILQREFPDWRLTIIGDGPDRSDLEKRIKAYGLDNISVTGFCDPLPYYKRASILSLVSEYEGFGLVLVEGMRYGCVPVALASFSAIHDVIPTDDEGLKVATPYEAEKMAGSLREIMSDENRLRAMSHAAIISTRRYKLANIVAKWEILFKEVLSN